MKKIIVPVDFSGASLNALEVACQLAERAGANIFLLHVNEMTPYILPVAEFAFATPVVDLEAYDKEVLGRLEKLKATILSETRYEKLQVELSVQSGVMVPVLRKAAADEAADLIVMGTLGASGWKEVFLGSNTERVIRHAPCPVLVVPEEISEFNIERVLVPSTFKPDQAAVLKLTKSWQEIFGFDVEMVYVDKALDPATRSQLEAEKTRLTEAAGLFHVYLHFNTLMAQEEDAIRSYADKAAADMIIMGTHQRHGLSHLLFGSVTENTANHSHIPVLAIPVGH